MSDGEDDLDFMDRDVTVSQKRAMANNKPVLFEEDDEDEPIQPDMPAASGKPKFENLQPIQAFVPNKSALLIASELQKLFKKTSKNRAGPLTNEFMQNFGQSLIIHALSAIFTVARADMVDEAAGITNTAQKRKEAVIYQASKNLFAANAAETKKQSAGFTVEFEKKKIIPKLAPFVAFLSKRAFSTVRVRMNSKKKQAWIGALLSATDCGAGHAEAIDLLVEYGGLDAVPNDKTNTQNWRQCAVRLGRFDSDEPPIPTPPAEPKPVPVPESIPDPEPSKKKKTAAKKRAISEITVEDQMRAAIDPPLPQVSSSTTTMMKPDRLLTLCGDGHAMMGSSASQFKWNATSLVMQLGSKFAIVPNEEMIQLLALTRQSMRSPDELLRYHGILASRHVRFDKVNPQTIMAHNDAARAFSALATPLKILSQEQMHTESTLDIAHNMAFRLVSKFMNVNIPSQIEDLLACGLMETAHVLFGFLRFDPQLHERIGDPAVLPSAILESKEPVTLGHNELPIGIVVSMTETQEKFLSRVWSLYCQAIDYDASSSNFKEFAKCRKKFTPQAKWKFVVDYWLKSFTPTDDQKREYRKLMIPFIAGLFPLPFIAPPITNK